MKKHAPTKLLIFNYVMDKSHPALAHQVDVVESLSLYFDFVTVITGHSNLKINEIPENVQIVSTNWRPDSNFRNVLNFYKKFFNSLRGNKYTCVFSHMTLIQSFLVAPILRVIRVRHYVWYAHAQNSIYLKIVYFFSNGLLTSTRGSCPIRGSKVKYLGQSVDENIFDNKLCKETDKLYRGVHIGRLDPAKNIEKIIETFIVCKKNIPNLNLTFVGNPSNKNSEKYISEIKDFWRSEIDSGSLTFLPAIPRDEIPQYLSNFDFFIHGFVGSLDKTLIEATLCKLPVVTLNVEYHNEFGSWPGCEIDLVSELDYILNCKKDTLMQELEIRRKIAIKNHSLARWIENLSITLLNGI